MRRGRLRRAGVPPRGGRAGGTSIYAAGAFLLNNYAASMLARARGGQETDADGTATGDVVLSTTAAGQDNMIAHTHSDEPGAHLLRRLPGRKLLTASAAASGPSSASGGGRGPVVGSTTAGTASSAYPFHMRRSVSSSSNHDLSGAPSEMSMASMKAASRGSSVETDESTDNWHWQVMESEGEGRESDRHVVDEEVFQEQDMQRVDDDAGASARQESDEVEELYLQGEGQGGSMRHLEEVRQISGSSGSPMKKKPRSGALLDKTAERSVAALSGGQRLFYSSPPPEELGPLSDQADAVDHFDATFFAAENETVAASARPGAPLDGAASASSNPSAAPPAADEGRKENSTSESSASRGGGEQEHFGRDKDQLPPLSRTRRVLADLNLIVERGHPPCPTETETTAGTAAGAPPHDSDFRSSLDRDTSACAHEELDDLEFFRQRSEDDHDAGMDGDEEWRSQFEFEMRIEEGFGAAETMRREHDAHQRRRSRLERGGTGREQHRAGASTGRELTEKGGMTPFLELANGTVVYQLSEEHILREKLLQLGHGAFTRMTSCDTSVPASPPGEVGSTPERAGSPEPAVEEDDNLNTSCSSPMTTSNCWSKKNTAAAGAGSSSADHSYRTSRCTYLWSEGGTHEFSHSCSESEQLHSPTGSSHFGQTTSASTDQEQTLLAHSAPWPTDGGMRMPFFVHDFSLSDHSQHFSQTPSPPPELSGSPRATTAARSAYQPPRLARERSLSSGASSAASVKRAKMQLGKKTLSVNTTLREQERKAVEKQQKQTFCSSYSAAASTNSNTTPWSHHGVEVVPPGSICGWEGDREQRGRDAATTRRERLELLACGSSHSQPASSTHERTESGGDAVVASTPAAAINLLSARSGPTGADVKKKDALRWLAHGTGCAVPSKNATATTDDNRWEPLQSSEPPSSSPRGPPPRRSGARTRSPRPVPGSAGGKRAKGRTATTSPSGAASPEASPLTSSPRGFDDSTSPRDHYFLPEQEESGGSKRRAHNYMNMQQPPLPGAPRCFKPQFGHPEGGAANGAPGAGPAASAGSDINDNDKESGSASLPRPASSVVNRCGGNNRSLPYEYSSPHGSYAYDGGVVGPPAPSHSPDVGVASTLVASLIRRGIGRSLSSVEKNETTTAPADIDMVQIVPAPPADVYFPSMITSSFSNSVCSFGLSVPGTPLAMALPPRGPSATSGSGSDPGKATAAPPPGGRGVAGDVLVHQLPALPAEPPNLALAENPSPAPATVGSDAGAEPGASAAKALALQSVISAADQNENDLEIVAVAGADTVLPAARNATRSGVGAAASAGAVFLERYCDPGPNGFYQHDHDPSTSRFEVKNDVHREENCEASVSAAPSSLSTRPSSAARPACKAKSKNSQRRRGVRLPAGSTSLTTRRRTHRLKKKWDWDSVSVDDLGVSASPDEPEATAQRQRLILAPDEDPECPSPVISTRTAGSGSASSPRSSFARSTCASRTMGAPGRGRDRERRNALYRDEVHPRKAGALTHLPTSTTGAGRGSGPLKMRLLARRPEFMLARLMAPENRNVVNGGHSAPVMSREGGGAFGFADEGEEEVQGMEMDHLLQIAVPKRKIEDSDRGDSDEDGDHCPPSSKFGREDEKSFLFTIKEEDRAVRENFDEGLSS